MIKGLGHLIRTMFGAKRPAPALPSFMVGAVEGDLVAVPPASDDVLRRAMEAASESAMQADANSHRSVQLVRVGDEEPQTLPTLFLHGKAREAEPLTTIEDVMAFPESQEEPDCEVPRLETLLTFQEIVEGAPLASQDVLKHAQALNFAPEVPVVAAPIVSEIAEMFAGTVEIQDLTTAEPVLEHATEVLAEVQDAPAAMAEKADETEGDQDWVTIYDPQVSEVMQEVDVVTIVDELAEDATHAQSRVPQENVAEMVSELTDRAEVDDVVPVEDQVPAVEEQPKADVSQQELESNLEEIETPLVPAPLEAMPPKESGVEPEMEIASEPLDEQVEEQVAEQAVAAKKPAKRKSPAKKKDAPATKRKKSAKAFPDDAVFLTDAVIWSQCGSWREFWLPPTDANSSQRVEEFRTLAAAGKFTIWGLPGEGPAGEGNEWTAIAATHWKKAGFDPLAFLAGRENAFSQAPAPKSKTKKPAEPAKYRSLMVSKAAIEELFGAAEQATAAVA